jgi:phosphate/sulfate permease
LADDRFLLRAARPSVNTWLRRSQFITSAGLAFSHGANDAQKSMGIITIPGAALVALSSYALVHLMTGGSA